MRTELKRALIVFVLVAAFGSCAFADVAANLTGTIQDGWPKGNGVGYCSGWRFWADEEITITHLGMLDWGDPGLTGSHKVGLWELNDPDPGATLLRSVNISGTDGTLYENYRYVEILDESGNPDPIILTADPSHQAATRYLIGVWTESEGSPADGLIIRPQGAVSVTNKISIENQLGRYTGTFDYPWSPTSDYDHFGVNFKYVLGVPPEEAIVGLIYSVEDIDLQQGIEMSLDAKLDAALNALDDVNANNDVTAINSLQAFISAVEAQRDNKITYDQATFLVGEAQAIIDQLSGS